ncbi:MAG TPA: thiamine pyrophosphate-binding protein [Nocardioides sp.]|uniref:thiamine pyrophosphate-binding protein n=1 Tax=Nocardioides sp. TaxID=35761 RepID=UPI002F418548
MAPGPTVAEVVGRTLVDSGVDHVFGVVGSGNFHVTNAMVAAGARFVAARHEGGAATMADAFARTSDRPAAVTVHQGCGLTNAMTGITEAAKSRTPVVVVAAEVTEPRSNFFVDQEALARAVGAVPFRVSDATTAREVARHAVRTAVTTRRTVVLNLPLAVQALTAGQAPSSTHGREEAVVTPSGEDLDRLVDAVRRAERPVFVAGRGARGAGPAVAEAAERAGALLAESAVAKGLFTGHPWSLGVSGGFASPGAAELIGDADLIVGWGCTLNMWTMRHGKLIAPGATVVQVDDTVEALGAHRELTFGVLGDVEATATELEKSLTGDLTGYRTDEVRRRLEAGIGWASATYDDLGGHGLIDPRTLTRDLDVLLPADRVVAVDSGNFMGYPAAYLGVGDHHSFCFTQAFQSIGLGLATAVGAAIASPGRLTVAALGDGGALMSAMELETVVRLGLDMLVVVYDDHAYGAEVHHFGPDGAPLDTVVFPDTDIAAIGRGFGFDAVTVRAPGDLDAVRAWLDAGRPRPMLVDAKVVDSQPSWWLEEAFRGH